ncbi:hypothetical protein BKG82_26895 [Mycobacteroides chelonae]|uniref:Uncharacterized protein n=1 Tax=Mycobacteroides chelonae TaxID=1774 RepID=A0A1S1LG68_MYCCH|nr:hypothetical protein [Mycobacteroides chelonae]OHU47281.1 hypothetical protein BKG82_26895 [Mycobacteroides chelonae]
MTDSNGRHGAGSLNVDRWTIRHEVELAYRRGRRLAYVAVIGPDRAKRREAGTVLAQIMTERWSEAAPGCTHVSAKELLGNTGLLQQPPGVSIVQGWTTSQAGVIMVEDLEPLVGPHDDPTSLPGQAVSQIITALLMAGEQPLGPLICWADSRDVLDRLLAGEPALRSRFNLQVIAEELLAQQQP